MNLDKLNHWLTLAANLGVLVGIVFLAYELRQNNKQLELQSYQAWVAANVQINTALTDLELSEIVAIGNVDPTGLSRKSFIAFAMWNMSVMQAAQSTDYLYRSGALDEELWKAEMSRAAGILSLPGVRQWWEAGGRTQLTGSFVSLLEASQSDIDTWNWNEDRGFFRDDELTRSSTE